MCGARVENLGWRGEQIDEMRERRRERLRADDAAEGYDKLDGVRQENRLARRRIGQEREDLLREHALHRDQAPHRGRAKLRHLRSRLEPLREHDGRVHRAPQLRRIRRRHLGQE